jgi:hypothetical protein
VTKVEEAYRKTAYEQKIIMKECKISVDNKDLRLEATRLHSLEQIKSILAMEV